LGIDAVFSIANWQKSGLVRQLPFLARKAA